MGRIEALRDRGPSTERREHERGSLCFFFILTIWFIVESGEYELITFFFFFFLRCYEQLWYSILVLGVGRIMIKKV